MDNTTGFKPSIEQIPNGDGTETLRFSSPRSLLWFALLIIPGTFPVGCTGGLMLFTSFDRARDSGQNLLIGILGLSVMAWLVYMTLKHTKRSIRVTPGVGLHTSAGDLPFKDISRIYVKGNPMGDHKAGGVIAVSNGRDIQLAHTSTVHMARDLLGVIESKGYVNKPELQTA